MQTDVAKLILRLLLGGLTLLHGIAKIMAGPAMMSAMVAKQGLPGPVGYLVYVGEVIAPVLLILGLWTRLGAVLVLINMLFAVGLVHMADLGQLNDQGGWAVELQAFYLFTALAVALLGAGRFSLGGSGGRWN
jgi:putative oxidoreductase